MKTPALSVAAAFYHQRRLAAAAIAAGAVIGAASLTANRAQAEPPAAVTEMPTASKDVLVVKENKGMLTLEADGKDVSVIGSHNKVTIKGKCHALTVSGASNVVTVEAVATISLPGADNQVTWTSAVGGAKPQITDTGKGNTAKKKAE